MLIRKDLDPNGELLDAIINSIIWGVKSASGQSECGVIKLASPGETEAMRY